ncbi:MAG: hypothetical protein K1X95_06435 [Acidimicrobiia bacterium]|nr:hypothetical protein [Acidimicrobiia bacterium]
MGLRDLFRPRARVAGPPASSNGASSMHVHWDCPRGTTAVAATLEVVSPPAVASLYFWALQASFTGPGGRHEGAGHIGLQWYAAHPGSTAVNWGGYAADGAELDGSASTLASATANPNTRDFPWTPAHAYRLRISAAGPGRWRGDVTDLDTGTVTHVRDLFCGGDHLASPCVWSEVFADCDAPPSAVRWSDLDPAPPKVRVTYQSHADGGCDNTTVRLDGPGALVQVTNVARELPHGALLPLR